MVKLTLVFSGKENNTNLSNYSDFVMFDRITRKLNTEFIPNQNYFKIYVFFVINYDIILINIKKHIIRILDKQTTMVYIVFLFMR